MFVKALFFLNVYQCAKILSDIVFKLIIDRYIFQFSSYLRLHAEQTTCIHKIGIKILNYGIFFAWVIPIYYIQINGDLENNMCIDEL